MGMSVAIVWILSIMLAMPNLIATEYEIDENNFAVCSENWEKIWKSAKNLDLCQSNPFVYENDYENMSYSGFGSEATLDELDFQTLSESSSAEGDDLFNIQSFFNVEISPSELEFVKTTNFYENHAACRTFTPDEMIDESIEDSYSACRCVEPDSRRIWLWILFVVCFVIP